MAQKENWKEHFKAICHWSHAAGSFHGQAKLFTVYPIVPISSLPTVPTLQYAFLQLLQLYQSYSNCTYHSSSGDFTQLLW